MLRVALAIIMTLHGIAHLVGFAGSWQLVATSDLPFRTTVLDGHVDLGKIGIRTVGVLWLLVSIAFVVAGGAAIMRETWWPRAALVVSVASLVLTILEWPEARIGMYVNLAIVAALVAVLRFQLV